MIAQQGTLEISRSRLRHNLELLQGRAGRAKLCAIVKADAYGHGVASIAELLMKEGVEWVGVYSLNEAVQLAKAGPFNILVLAPLVIRRDGMPPRELVESIAGRIRVNLTDAESARQLARGIAEAGIRGGIPVHVQVDTGLTRMGADLKDVVGLVETIVSLPQLRFEGMFAHLSHGDVAGDPAVGRQLEGLTQCAEPFKKRWPELLVHGQNSGGAWHVGDAGLDMVRIGIAMYGLQPSTKQPIEGLLPIARVTARILAIHERPAGVGVGYGHVFKTERESRLAVLPVGYADGFPRQMTGRGIVQVRGKDVPVVGRVSMDQIIVDVTDVAGGVTAGEEVTVISWDAGKANSLDKIADAMGTIGYELATHLGSRFQRVVVD